MAIEEPRQNFWQTLPGILTATAGVLTAVTGLYLAIVQNRGSDREAADPPAAAASAPATATRATREPPPAVSTPSAPPPASASPASGVKPWADSTAELTTADGSVTAVRAETLSNCISVSHAITLANGQTIPFELMRSVEFVRSDPAGAPNGRATIVVTLLDGRSLNGSMGSGCGIFGYNDIGRFDVNIDQLKRIDFLR
jgi:hypothetical protein